MVSDPKTGINSTTEFPMGVGMIAIGPNCNGILIEPSIMRIMMKA